MLKVTMHWYWFQMFTIRSTFSSPVQVSSQLDSSCGPLGFQGLLGLVKGICASAA